MRTINAYTLSILLAVLTLSGGCKSFAQEPKFKPMFNGKDLSGWRHVNTAPSTWKVEDNMLICSGKPIGELRTLKMYQNFIMELEWRHMKPRGNAGIFVWADDITAKGQPFHRGIEVQVLENAYGQSRGHTTHGDIFPIHGAKMKPINGRGGSRAFPTEELSNPSPQWNHYRITCIDGDISLAVNGKVVTRGTDCSPRKGYICIESEGGIVHYRNVRIKELPGTPVPREHVAIAERGYRSLYTGVDLSGWTAAPNQKNWSPSDWVLKYRAETEHSPLVSKEEFKDFGFIIDFNKRDSAAIIEIQLRGTQDTAIQIDPKKRPFADYIAQGWNRIEGTLLKDKLSFTINGTKIVENQKLDTSSTKGPIKLAPTGLLDLANIYVREL